MIYKILQIADIHLGRTNHSLLDQDGYHTKQKDTENALQQITEIINEQEPDVIVVAGDIFQIPKPSPIYISKIIEILSSWKDKCFCLIAISGNHDSSPSAVYNALQPLKSATKHISHYHIALETCTIPHQELNFVCVPHNNEIRRKPASTLINFINESPNLLKENLTNIFVSHFPIDVATRFFDESQLLGEDIQFKTIKKSLDVFDLCLLGDIHSHQKLGENIFYSGSIIQNTFSEEVEEKGVYIHEVDTTDGTIESKFHKIQSRQYKTIVLENFEDYKEYSPDDYRNSIIRIKLNITGTEKLFDYEKKFKDHFSKSFMVLSDFSQLKQTGMTLKKVNSSNLMEATLAWIKEVYKDDPDLDFLLREGKDILEKKIEEKQKDL